MSNAAGGAPSSARILIASLVGTAVEFYDFYIYATAASLVFGPLFFPVASPSAQLMAAYGSFGIAFLARPLGSIVFGHYGDRIGRKSTLVASLLLMGGSTVLIGLLPTYDSIGWLAPFLLCVLRFGQGFGLGGEWGGAVLLAVENAPSSHRARYGMFPQIGAPVGFIAANGLFLLLGEFLTPGQFHDWGWRLPFLGSAVLVLLGLWVRLKLTETPAFAKALEEGPPPPCPWPRWRAITPARPWAAPSPPSPASRCSISPPPSPWAMAPPSWVTAVRPSWECSWAPSCSWPWASSRPAGGRTWPRLDGC
ncbi:MFS transporter [Nitrospirillum sp. BR 11163]|uniref:MFS transporter n=1 Tax=Nitrospirillum sp. BR 11163 TaxID=3104323 RepID=UPI002B00384E|nr:MFS transporter [Nitrospirillum sp. BR 11163]MEA1674877.1 MFS transporter [Nitrospirillum sp. BR 11163]